MVTRVVHYALEQTVMDSVLPSFEIIMWNQDLVVERALNAKAITDIWEIGINVHRKADHLLRPMEEHTI